MARVLGFDHIQIAMPRGKEDVARAFYAELIGLKEIPKPATLAARGGLWFECGDLQLHLGVEEPFIPARKAHPALRVSGYNELLTELLQAGILVTPDTALPGVSRAFVADPFGNRVELINAKSAA